MWTIDDLQRLAEAKFLFISHGKFKVNFPIAAKNNTQIIEIIDKAEYLRDWKVRIALPRNCKVVINRFANGEHKALGIITDGEFIPNVKLVRSLPIDKVGQTVGNWQAALLAIQNNVFRGIIATKEDK